MTVAEALRIALNIEGITQAELSSLTRLTEKHVSQLFTGKVPLSVDVALRIEAALTCVSAEELMIAQARQQVREARSARVQPNGAF